MRQLLFLLLSIAASAQINIRGGSSSGSITDNQHVRIMGQRLTPTLPLFSVNETIPVLAGTQRYVWNTCASSPNPATCTSTLQAAINAASCGDTINIHAGETHTETNISFHSACTGTGTSWIIIQTDDVALPASGTRVTAADATHMPKFQTNTNNAAIISPASSSGSGYRFIGIEFTCTSVACPNGPNGGTSGFDNALIQLDSGATTYAAQPHHVIIDRCYIHGISTSELRRGVNLGGAYEAVVDSLIKDIHEEGNDTQAIGGTSFPGPTLIRNNRLEAAGENILFGGSLGSLANNLPSDSTIKGNYFFKSLTWKVDDPSYGNIHWSVKNILEFKECLRCLVDGNVFENNWADGQDGDAWLLTPRGDAAQLNCNQGSIGGAQGWSNSIASDITYINNVILHVGDVIDIDGVDSNDCFPAPMRATRIKIYNNLAIDVNNRATIPGTSGATGTCFKILGSATYITIDHNTCRTNHEIAAVDVAANAVPVGRNNAPITITNNVFDHGLYGWFASGFGSGTVGFNADLSPYTFHHNVMMGETVGTGLTPNDYPINSQGGFANGNKFCDVAGTTNTCYPTTWADMVSDTNCNITGQTTPDPTQCAITNVSPFHNAGLDGKDLGADMTVLAAVVTAVRK